MHLLQMSSCHSMQWMGTSTDKATLDIMTSSKGYQGNTDLQGSDCMSSRQYLIFRGMVQISHKPTGIWTGYQRRILMFWGAFVPSLHPCSFVVCKHRNPIGRTGLVGRGLLDHWGPNHTHCHIVTRYVCQGSQSNLKSGWVEEELTNKVGREI